jgi:hypothetical protein
MTDAVVAWCRHPDVAWTADDVRVIAARTSPPDIDGPRILEGAAASVWLRLSKPQTHAELAADAGRPEVVEQALMALSEARLIEPT